MIAADPATNNATTTIANNSLALTTVLDTVHLLISSPKWLQPRAAATGEAVSLM
jgi:hypothetical protein